MSDSSLDPGYWTQQTEALRRIARAIVGDAGLADDVAQAAWVTALKRDRASGDGGWLRRVVRSRAIDALRTRRAEPRSTGVDPEGCPARGRTPDSTAERLELQRQLVEAVEGLAEPYRGTVALVYFDGWSVNEVSRVQSVPPSTVHTRLRRALDQLRHKMGANPSGGGDCKWTPALLAFAQGPLRPPGAALPGITSLFASSTLAMNKLLFAVVATCALVAVWLARDAASPTPLSGTSVGVSAGESALVSPKTELAGAHLDDERSAASGPEPSPAHGASRAAPSLIVDVRWHDGTPAVGVEALTAQDRKSVPSPRRFLERTDAAGRAVFADLPIGTHHVRTSLQQRSDKQAVQVIDGSTATLQLRLPQGIDVVGSVVDFDGAPVAGAEVWMCTRSGGWTQDVWAGRTDPAGRFEVRQAPRGTSFGARAAGHARSALTDLDDLDLSAEPVDVRLRLAAGGAQVSGIVIDEAGDPIAGARVVAGKVESWYDTRADDSVIEDWSSPRTTTGEGGEFEFVGLEPGELVIYARAPGMAVTHSEVTIEKGMRVRVELELGAGATLEGTVRGIEGDALAGATVRIFEERLNETFLQSGQVDYYGAFGHAAARTDELGRYRVESVPAGPIVAYAMYPVPPQRWGDSQPVPFVRNEFDLAHGEVREWDVQITEGLVVEGSVTYSDGSPMQNIFVNLSSSNPSTAQEGTARLRRSLNTADGTFRFIGLKDSTYDVRAQVWDLPEGCSEPRMIGVRPGGEPIRLVADFGPPVQAEQATVQIRVDQPADAPPGGIGVELQRRDGKFSWVIGVESDGVWSFEVHEPGTYGPQVKRGERIVWVGEEFEIAGGEDLDLGTADLEEGATLRVHLKYPEGWSGTEAHLRLSPEGTWSSEIIEVEGRTEFDVVGLTPGSHSLQLSGEGFVRADKEIELKPGETHVTTIRLAAAVKVSFTIQREVPEPSTSILAQVVNRTDQSIPFEYKFKDASNILNPWSPSAWLAPGSYVFIVERGDGRTQRHEFEVTTLQQTDAPLLVADFR